MEERTLEVNIVSAEELRRVKTFGAPKCYVKTYIYSNQKKATKVDKIGGLNPRWNTKLLLTCDEQLLRQPGYVLSLDLFSHGILRNKLIGAVTIPLAEIARDEKLSGKPQVMAFQVRSRRSGRLRGVLNVSVRLGEKRIIQYQQGGYPQQAAYPPAYGGGGYGPQYGAPQKSYGQEYSQYGAGNQRRPRNRNPGLGVGLVGGGVGGIIVGDMGDFGGGGF